jgi:RNA polymerase sigma factor (sigma-70 family)
MIRTASSPTLQMIRRVAADPRMRCCADEELLGRFVEHHDEAALETLVRRHGPMILDVCRGALPNEADVEDAFQATFLVLAQKASSIRNAVSLASWLHGVAYRTACKARTEFTRRRKHEAGASAAATEGAADELAWCEVRHVVHQELNALSGRYRAPLVLCYLEGKTQDEAARSLGLAKSTFKDRLERGRTLLRARLVHRGLGPAALVVVSAWPAAGFAACVPTSLVLSTIKAANSIAAGQTLASGVISAAVATLTQRVLRAMLLTKLKMAMAVLFIAAFTAVAVGLVGFPAGAAESPKDGKASTAPFTSAGHKKPEQADPDCDGDGLLDFHEVHKYRTDPNKKDTAGKGLLDGDLPRHRQFTYSVRAVIRVMPPYNLKALNDDYQDVRVLKETKEFVELEVVLYPFNSNAEAITGNPNWKKDYAGMTEYLAPGITTNWDEQMRKDLLRELAKDGIDPDRLTDKEVVEQVSRWLFKRSTHRSMFCTFFVGFRDGKPAILPGLEERFDREKGDPKWTVQEQFEHELFGKQMFARKTYGTCTSTAIYQTTVLRALGIPTRMILCIPPADGSDPAQLELIERGLTNHRVRCDVATGVISSEGFTSHTLCEVFVGGRWRRLNFTTLAQNVLERNYLGLMIKVHMFNDLSEARLAETWGARYAKSQRDEFFPRNNPYRLLEVGDHFGKHARVPNPPADKEHKQITIGKVYWAKDAHEHVRKMRTFAGKDDGRFFIHGEEWLRDVGYHQYKLFNRRADRNFVLRAKGRPDVSCHVSDGYVTWVSQDLRELEMIIPAAEYAKMAKGVAYSLHPVNGKTGYEWKVSEGVKLTRD